MLLKDIADLKFFTGPSVDTEGVKAMMTYEGATRPRLTIPCHITENMVKTDTLRVIYISNINLFPHHLNFF